MVSMADIGLMTIIVELVRTGNEDGVDFGVAYNAEGE